MDDRGHLEWRAERAAAWDEVHRYAKILRRLGVRDRRVGMRESAGGFEVYVTAVRMPVRSARRAC